MEKIKWLIINYNLPTEPSRHRVSIWRGLKKLGAVNIQQSMWVLPFREENYNALMQMSKDIETNNGEALLMESVFFEDSHEQRVVSLFNNLRDEEYTEWINESEKYLKEIAKEISIEKFTFAELEEEEQELEKLISWLKKIENRDIFNSSEGDKARAILAQTKKAFEEYSEMVCSKELRD